MLNVPSVRELVVTMGSVAFFGAGGLGWLVVLRRAAADRGKALRLSDVPDRIVRLLMLTDLLPAFSIAPA